MEPVRIAVAPGDGIGPEITDAVLAVLAAAEAPIDVVEVSLGAAAVASGYPSGVAPGAIEVIRDTGVLLKGPLATPSAGGAKSTNVTLRKTFGLYANVRPCVARHPFIPSAHPGMDVVVIRENEEDLYAGIEHRQTAEVTQCLKLITRPGCERIIRYAFAYAEAHGRTKVTAMSKDNIMKLTDGLFHQVFDSVAAEYPHLDAEHRIVDAGAARLAVHPEQFDVIVTPNLYGDIISDIAAELAGGLGVAGSANVGDDVALFEAIAGTAPDIAGRGIANPSGLLLAAVEMLTHIGAGSTAATIANAWAATLEDGIVTADVAGSRPAVGTAEFADAVIARLGVEPRHLAPVTSTDAPAISVKVPATPATERRRVGADVFIAHRPVAPSYLARLLAPVAPEGVELSLISNRGQQVWPDGSPETLLVDHWRCRFTATAELDSATFVELVRRVEGIGCEVIKVEGLYTFDGVAGFSVAQGQ